jgi:phage terminase small subunit
MGRPPTPTALKLLNGSAKAHPGRINRDEPMPAIGAEPPDYLPTRGPARRAWERLAPMLTRLRILTEADADALAAVCLSLAEYLAAKQHKDQWRRAADAQRRCIAGLATFGLDPQARIKVKVLPPTEKDPLEAWEDS